MFYIAYINNKDKTELTGIESYVKHCLDQKEIKWFPIQRARGLDHGESVKLDEMNDFEEEILMIDDESNDKIIKNTTRAD